MRKEEIQKLIDRYFEGETTLEEERRLYEFFQKDNIPAEFEEYTEMFRDFAAADNAFVPCIPAKRPVRIKFTWLRAAVSTAAIAAMYSAYAQSATLAKKTLLPNSTREAI